MQGFVLSVDEGPGRTPGDDALAAQRTALGAAAAASALPNASGVFPKALPAPATLLQLTTLPALLHAGRPQPAAQPRGTAGKRGTATAATGASGGDSGGDDEPSLDEPWLSTHSRRNLLRALTALLLASGSTIAYGMGREDGALWAVEALQEGEVHGDTEDAGELARFRELARSREQGGGGVLEAIRAFQWALLAANYLPTVWRSGRSIP